MVTNETLYHKDPATGKPQVIGLGWLDDSMTSHGPTEEDRNVRTSMRCPARSCPPFFLGTITRGILRRLTRSRD